MNTRTSPQPISIQDLTDYLNEDSSFAFEMRVREIFASKRLSYKHGGTYLDPHTGLPRQFDLQADLNCSLFNTPLRILLAIECKCLSEFAPMLVSRSPRSDYESGHLLVATTCGERNRVFKELNLDNYNYHPSGNTGPFPKICVLDICPKESMYHRNEHVGKAIDVVGKDGNGKFKGGDKEIYGRWSQALQSLSNMLNKVKGEFYADHPCVINWFLPILVIPDDRLFVVDFDDNGTKIRGPESAASTSFFVDYTPPDFSVAGPKFKISHLEIFTYSALKEFLSNITCSESQRFLDHHYIDEHACYKSLSQF